MREHIDHFGQICDLDNPETYSYLPKTTKELDNLMFRYIGETICYMDYFHPDIFIKDIKDITNGSLQASGYNQRLRVNELIKDFTTNRKYNYENVLWYQEQIFLFKEETENMC